MASVLQHKSVLSPGVFMEVAIPRSGYARAEDLHLCPRPLLDSVPCQGGKNVGKCWQDRKQFKISRCIGLYVGLATSRPFSPAVPKVRSNYLGLMFDC